MTNAVASTSPSPDRGATGATSEVDQRGRRRKAIVLLVLLAGLLMVLLLFAWYLIFRQPISPIPPIGNVFNPPTYSTSIYRPSSPIGVAVSADGSRIYAAETEGERALITYDASGKLVSATRPPVDATGAEHVPVWIAIDPVTAEVYASDRPTGNIYIYNRDGAFLRTYKLAKPIKAWQPMGLAFDASGNLFVADVGGDSQRIEVIDRAGNIVRTFGEDEGFSFLNGVAVDKSGVAYVVDSNNGRVLAYQDGKLIARVGRGTDGGSLALPRGVAIDDQGRVYVGDSTAMGVQVLAPADASTRRIKPLGFFGGPGTSNGKFTFPNGVAMDQRGRVYIADTFNSRIQVWSY